MWVSSVWCDAVCVIQEQSQIIWQIRDNLQREVSLDALRGLLEYNKQEIRSGESKVSVAPGGFATTCVLNLSYLEMSICLQWWL